MGALTGLSGLSGLSGVVGSGSTPPTITSSAAPSVVEGTTAVVTVTATGGQTPYTFSISGGADQALFTINASSGALAFAVAPDYAAPGDVGGNNVYNVEVTAASVGGAESDPQAIAVTVTFDPLALALELRYDPASDVYTDAGTTLATDGQSIYQAANQGTPANPLVQTNSVKRPARQDVSGVKTLQHADNERHFLLTTEQAFSNMEDFYLSAAVDISGTSDYSIFGDTSSNMQFRFAATEILLVANAAVYWRSTSTNPQGKHYLDLEVVSGIPTVRIDGAAVSGAFEGGHTTVPALSVDAFGMTPAGAGGIVGNTYAATIRRGAITTARRTALMAYDLALMGLSLAFVLYQGASEIMAGPIMG